MSDHTAPVGIADSPYLTAEEAAAYLRYRDIKAFYKAVLGLRIPHRRCGTRFLFVAAELDVWLEERAAFLAGERTAQPKQDRTPLALTSNR